MVSYYISIIHQCYSAQIKSWTVHVEKMTLSQQISTFPSFDDREAVGTLNPKQ